MSKFINFQDFHLNLDKIVYLNILISNQTEVEVAFVDGAKIMLPAISQSILPEALIRAEQLFVDNTSSWLRIDDVEGVAFVNIKNINAYVINKSTSGDYIKVITRGSDYVESDNCAITLLYRDMHGFNRDRIHGTRQVDLVIDENKNSSVVEKVKDITATEDTVKSLNTDSNKEESSGFLEISSFLYN